MIPVDQEHLRGWVEGQTEPVGDCFRASLASLLELPLEAVPHFVDDDKRHGVEQWKAMRAWFGERGFCWVEIQPNTHAYSALVQSGAFYIASGPAERGHQHSVVFRGRKMAHDPHPDRTGLIRVEWCGFAVPLAPSFGVVPPCA